MADQPTFTMHSDDADAVYAVLEQARDDLDRRRSSEKNGRWFDLHQKIAGALYLLRETGAGQRAKQVREERRLERIAERNARFEPAFEAMNNKFAEAKQLARQKREEAA